MKLNDPKELIIAAEQRVGRPVEAASLLRMGDRENRVVYVLAYTWGVVWFLELRRDRLRRTSLGQIVGWRYLKEYDAVHTTAHRRGRYAIALSKTGELLEGELYGAGAAHLVGMLDVERFRFSSSEALRSC